jgi:hypothetical protein
MKQPILARLVPFLLLGVAIVAFLFGMLLMAYLFVFGALLGLALFMISWVRERFFPTKTIVKRSGRTIDQDHK